MSSRFGFESDPRPIAACLPLSLHALLSLSNKEMNVEIHALIKVLHSYKRSTLLLRSANHASMFCVGQGHIRAHYTASNIITAVLMLLIFCNLF